MTNPTLSLKRVVDPEVAVTRFLKDMAKVASRSFPAWQKTLVAGIEECPLSYDQRRAIFDLHPLDDYYFAGVVALEAAKIHALFPPDEASELLSLLAERIDAAADRTDRAVSDITFFMVNRLELIAGIDKQKMPYDQIVKLILQRLGLDKIEATRHLMSETLYRHTLGEPLALGVPQWWRAFRAKYSLTGEGIEHAPAEIKITPPAPPKRETPPPAKPPRRAVVFN
jgi:hypothetical protein